MTQDINNPKHYTADKGYTFKRKEDGFIMGSYIFLGKYNLNPTVDDTIENYEEVIDETYVDPSEEENINYSIIEDTTGDITPPQLE